jgi:hypothetical protein
MAKGSARVDVKNEEGYKRYAAANPAIFKNLVAAFCFAPVNMTPRKVTAARAISSLSREYFGTELVKATRATEDAVMVLLKKAFELL